MTIVRLARIERRIPPGPVPDRFPTHVLVLADDTGQRELPIWLLGRDSHRFDDHARFEPAADQLTIRLLHAAATRVTAVEVDELGPEVTVARIELATPGGPGQVTARLLDGLAAAIAAGAPIRVAAPVLERLAHPAGPAGAGDDDDPVPGHTRRDLQAGGRRESAPGNLGFTAGLEHWGLGGSFTENAVRSHWQDYDATARDGTAVLAATGPEPAGFAWLAQEILAASFGGRTVTFRGQFRVPDSTGRAGLFVRVMRAQDVRGPFTAAAALADRRNHLVTVESQAGWVAGKVTAPVPDETGTIAFGVFLAGPGRIELRDVELVSD